MTRRHRGPEPSTRTRHVSELVIALATLAMVVMIADLVVNPVHDSWQFLGFVQLVLALVCLVVGVLYLFGERSDGGESDLDDPAGDDVVIDLRQSAPPLAEPVSQPRQVPDARATNVFRG